MLIVAIFFSLKKAVGLLDEALQRKAKLTLSFQTKSINYWNFKEKKKKEWKTSKLPNFEYSVYLPSFWSHWHPLLFPEFSPVLTSS